jgi:rhodanese-related sulfurtransferase
MDYEITPEEVKAKLDASDSFTLLDVREPWEFETARIGSAKLMPWEMSQRGRIRNWIRRITSLCCVITVSGR